VHQVASRNGVDQGVLLLRSGQVAARAWSSSDDGRWSSRHAEYRVVAHAEQRVQILWVYSGLLIASRPVIAWNVIPVVIDFLFELLQLCEEVISTFTKLPASPMGRLDYVIRWRDDQEMFEPTKTLDVAIKASSAVQWSTALREQPILLRFRWKLVLCSYLRRQKRHTSVSPLTTPTSYGTK
jgi:hypothetical protein